ncbi:hypothetical protein C1Y11_29115, partial [Pseudomonas sp. FW305-20]
YCAKNIEHIFIDPYIARTRPRSNHHAAINATTLSDEGTQQENDDSQMSDQKSHMLLTPRETTESYSR